MSAEDLRALDIALATQARGMSSRLLSEDDREKLRGVAGQEELIAFLRRTPGWAQAARELPAGDVTERQFAEAMEREVYHEYERLYRFAQNTAKDFLIFIALRIKLKSVLSALRRLSNPGAEVYDDPLPPFFHRLPGYDIDRLMKVASYDELIAVGGDGIYGDTLRSLPRNEATGLPNYAEAADLLEDRFYSAVAEFLEAGYRGPDKESLRAIVGFRADMLNVSYLLRLRRFRTPPEKAKELLLPLQGSLGWRTEETVLAAGSDEEAIGELLASPIGAKLNGLEPTEPERFVRAAEDAYFRRIIRGAPTLSVAYAFMTLKESECDMLKRAYTALQYGVSPGEYM